jgi:periplasmic mercuric ion binding protein
MIKGLAFLFDFSTFRPFDKIFKDMNTFQKIGLSFFIFTLGMALLGSVPAVARGVQLSDDSGESTFTVLGNCGMCKERIERAAYTVRGVRSALWNQEEQELTVKFRPERTSQEQIERAVAKAGHDTENFLTHDEIHANLHSCCIYERDPEMLKKNKRFDEE